MELAQALAELMRNGATIAISVEPRGGSPTGAPTGPVIASGALTRA
jgi:anti-sigma-K factor RskA